MLDDRPLLQRYHTRGNGPTGLYCDFCMASSFMIYGSDGIGTELDCRTLWFGVNGSSLCPPYMLFSDSHEVVPVLLTTA